MESSSNQKTCLVTGANGYLGRHVKAALEQRGWRVVELVRNPKPGDDAKRFLLGQEVAPEFFDGASALVHCAYDFKPLVWTDIYERNVVGSRKLLHAARQANLQSIVYISSISAFEECRSLYGRAKLETEKIALSLDAFVIRPGLIYGDSAEGMFGKIVNQVERTKVLPLFGGGRQVQYLIHEEDLCDLICRCVAKEITLPEIPVTIANEIPWTFKQLLETIAGAKGKKLLFVPMPWRLVWAAIKSAELLGAAMNFRSDSLVSLIYQNPKPSFVEQRELKVVCRPFRLD